MLAFDTFDAESRPHRESLLGTGNGVLFVRAAAPEAAFGAAASPGEHYPGLYRAGFYNHALRRIEGRTLPITALVRLPDPFGLSFRHEGEDAWFGLGAGTVETFRHALHMAEGLAQRDWTLLDPAGRRTQVCETRAASLADPELAWVHWQVKPLNWSGRVIAASPMQTTAANSKLSRTAAYEGNHLSIAARASTDADELALQADTLDGRRRVALSSRLVCRPPGERLKATLRCSDGAPLETQQTLQVQAGQPFDLVLWVRVRPIEQATDHSAAFTPPNLHLALDTHHHAWRTLWQHAMIEAPHDVDLERSCRFAAFQLLQTASPLSVGQDAGLPSRGWQEGYFGHVFWDATFAFPFLTMRFPDIARELLEYRHRRLDAARQAAHAAGHVGAMFPWRSADTGEEETPKAQWIPPARRWKPDPTHLQRHIGSAIAHDAWQQYLATGDEAHFVRCGGVLLVEIARYWMSNAVEGIDGRLEYRGVIGPDEYHERQPGAIEPGLSNNAYTNGMASWTLDCAARISEYLSASHWEALQHNASIQPDEPQAWGAASRRIALPRLAGDVIAQFDGFETLLPADTPGLPKRHADEREDWWLMAHGDDVNRYQVTKQADVLTLFHLLGQHGMDSLIHRLGLSLAPGWQARTLRHYLDRISHESSLSRVVVAGALCLNDPKESWRNFRKALHTDLAASRGGSTHEGLHLGALAGCWDVLQRCYLGLWLVPDGIELRPFPPEGLDDVSTVLWVRRHRLRLHLRGSVLRLTCECAGASPLHWVHDGQRELLVTGRVVDLRCR